MADYFLTAFDPSGKTLVNERFEAENEETAKTHGEALLKEKASQSYPSFSQCSRKADFISQMISFPADLLHLELRLPFF